MNPHQRRAAVDGIRRVCLVGVLLAAAMSLVCNKPNPSMHLATRFPVSPTPVPAPTPPALSGPTGSYTVTLTASPSCAVVTDSVSGEALPFPDSVRMRSYAGEFANGYGKLSALDGTGNHIQIGGIDTYAYRYGPLMFVQDGELTIIVPPADGGGNVKSSPSCAGGDYWWEVLSDTSGDKEALETCGTWRGSTENPERIDGTISGSFGYYRGVGPRWSAVLFCSAPDHHFTLTKR
jgi:hypothetical protein